MQRSAWGMRRAIIMQNLAIAMGVIAVLSMASLTDVAAAMRRRLKR